MNLIQSLVPLAVVLVPCLVLAQATAPSELQLRVLDRNGGPVQHCKVSLLRAIGDPVRYARVIECAERTLVPADFTGDFATIAGPKPEGFEFVVRVVAELHAPTFSAKFRLDAEKPTEVVVRLTVGGVLEGVVTTTDGKPVAGARVDTADVGLAASPALAEMFAKFVPEVITKTGCTTDAEGRYRLAGLAFGDYRIVVHHPDWCTAEHEHRVVDEKAVTLPIRVSRGSVVAGVVTTNGEPASETDVMILEPAEAVGQAAAKRTFLVKTDAQGRYRFPQQIPAGAWQIVAIPPMPGGNPLDKLRWLSKTQRPLNLVAGTDVLDADFALPAK